MLQGLGVMPPPPALTGLASPSHPWRGQGWVPELLAAGHKEVRLALRIN